MEPLLLLPWSPYFQEFLFVVCYPSFSYLFSSDAQHLPPPPLHTPDLLRSQGEYTVESAVACASSSLVFSNSAPKRRRFSSFSP